jgi:hypothetical protein
MRLWPWIFAPLVSAMAVMLLLVALPSSFLDAQHRGRGERLRRRIEGAFFVILGAIMAIPGVPGPGVVLIVMGLALLFAPERRFAAQPEKHRRMFEFINRLRVRFGRPPLRFHHP